MCRIVWVYLIAVYLQSVSTYKHFNSTCSIAVFAAEGGFEAISQSFVKLAESVGVSFQTGKTATQIAKNGVHVRNSNTKNDDKIADDSFVPADLIIVNADLPYASMSLIADSDDESTNDRKESRYDWDPSYLYSSGVLAFHWSIDKELVDLKTHNVYLAAASGRSQAEESWRLLRKGSQNTKNPTGVEPFNFYVHCPTKTDPSAAPEGCDSIMVLVPCPTLQRKKEFAKLPRDEAIAKYKEQFNEKVVTEMRQAVLDRFSVFDSLKDLKDHILDEVVDTPGTYADSYNVAAGTPFALSHGFGQLSLTRPGMHSSESNNILYCGASSRPGNGVPLVLIGSKLVSKKAISVIKKLSTG